MSEIRDVALDPESARLLIVGLVKGEYDIGDSVYDLDWMVMDILGSLMAWQRNANRDALGEKFSKFIKSCCDAQCIVAYEGHRYC